MGAPRPFRCDICSQEFTRSENLQRHRTSKHGGGARHRYECTKCHSRFHRRDVCKRHTERCTGHVSNSRSRRLSPGAQTQASSRPNPSTPAPPHVGSIDPSFNEPLLDGEPLNTGPSAPSTGLSDALVSQYVDSYFHHFHRSLPILHRPTFSSITAPLNLLKIVVAIGSLYSISEEPEPRREHVLRVADKLWKSGVKELKSTVARDRKEVREASIVQAFVLYIIYGVYRDDGSRFQKSRDLLRALVDHVRDVELLHQHQPAEDDAPWETGLAPDLSHDPAQLDARWAAFISQESMKRALYALVFLDSHVLAPCNLRPSLSAIELGWPLPHASHLWEATTPPTTWLAQQQQHSSDVLPTPTPSTRSLASATQSLLSGTPCPSLLAALAASPFAALCVAANLDALVRDLTRCHYQLPPSPADPSAFHVLSQTQNKAVSAALRALVGVAARADDDDDDDDDEAPLRHAVWLLAASTRAGLCAPDELLIGGVVDGGGVAAGLATAAHLVLGSYFASRRAALQTPSAAGGEDFGGAGSWSLLAQVMPVVEGAVAGDGGEAPWVTVVTVRLLLVLWKALRHVVGRLRRGEEGGGRVGAFDPARAVVRAVARSVEERLAAVVPGYEGSAGGDDGEEDFGYQERCVLSLAAEMCKKRGVWPVGLAAATIFEDIISGMAQS